MEKILGLNLRTTCSNNCIFCADSSKNKCGLVRYVYTDPDSIKVKIKAAAMVGYRAVYLTGTEPLNHLNIIELIRYARFNKFIHIEVITAGLRLKDVTFLKKIIQAGASEFTLAIYGADRRTHEAVTRTRGSFGDTIKALDNLRGQDVRVGLVSIFTQKNYKNMAVLTAFIIASFPGMYFKIDSVAAFSNSLSEYKYVVPRFEAAAPFLREAAKIYKKKYSTNLPRILFFAKSLLYVPLCIVSRIFDKDLLNLSILIRRYRFRQKYDPRKSFPFESFAKIPSCKSCRFYVICCGISRSYIETYGKIEFKAV